MSFDSDIENFHKDKERVNTTPAIVTETFEYGNSLVNTDYLGKLIEIELIRKYVLNYKSMNLYERGWRFNFGTSRQWAGLCSKSADIIGKSSANKNIYVSIEFVKHDAAWKENMRQTILHEISHAIVMEIFSFDTKNAGVLHDIDDLHKASSGHGVVWKSVCKALSGSDCRIMYEKGQFKESFKKYMYDCSSCGNVGYGDYPRFTSNCSQCNKPVLVEANII